MDLEKGFAKFESVPSLGRTPQTPAPRFQDNCIARATENECNAKRKLGFSLWWRVALCCVAMIAALWISLWVLP